MTIITPQIVPLIFVSAGVVGVVAMLSALLLIQAIAVALFGIETKQRPLEALRPGPEQTATPAAMVQFPAQRRGVT